MQRGNWLSHIAFGALVLAFVSQVNAQEFDPKSVRSTTCGNGNYNCGYTPTSLDEQRAVPEAPTVRMRGLPASFDLSPKMPPPGNQGQQNSCVAWASAYALKSYHEQVERNWGYDSPALGGQGNRVFSPAYVYNQINGGQDKGSNIQVAMNLFVQQGAVPWSVMPYNQKDYRTQPTAQARQIAAQYKARRYYRVGYDDMTTIKSEIVRGNPLVFGMSIDDAFYKVKGTVVYDARGGEVQGGHAMTIVGYDDNKISPRGDRGAVKILNSWGTSWGDKGYGWVSYRMFQSLTPYIMQLSDDTTTQPTPTVIQQQTGIRPPTQVAATAGTYPDKVVVTWSPVHGAVAYTIYRAEPASSSFEELGNSDTTTYTDKSIQPNAAYRYKIVASDDEDETDLELSPIAEGYARPQATAQVPAQVVGLSGEADGSGKIDLTWTAVPGATGYRVTKYSYEAKQWQDKGTANRTSYSDPNPQEKNYYAVRAINNSGVGKWSQTLFVAGGTREDEIPAIPSDVVASQGTFKTYVLIEWAKVPGATKYQVYRYDPESEELFGPVETKTNMLKDDDKSVLSGEEFSYVVTAVNRAGTSDYSEVASGRANPLAQRAGMVLDPPKNLKATVDEQKASVSLDWDGVKDASEYYVFRKKQKDQQYQYVATVPPGTTQYTDDKGLKTKGEVYFYIVRTKSALGGESVNSQAVAAFVNKDRVAARHRLLPGQGVEQFSGKWTGSLFDGISAPKPVELVIQDGGPGSADFKGTIKIGAETRTFAGSFPAGAANLAAQGLTMKLLSSPEVAKLEISGLFAQDVVVSVERAK